MPWLAALLQYYWIIPQPTQVLLDHTPQGYEWVRIQGLGV